MLTRLWLLWQMQVSLIGEAGVVEEKSVTEARRELACVVIGQRTWSGSLAGLPCGAVKVVDSPLEDG